MTTTDVRAAIVELQGHVLWIQSQTSGLELPADRRARMALGCLDLAIEHQAGISVLADQPLWGPAFALVRCLLDSFARGIWLARRASESELDSFERDGLRGKPFGELITEIEDALGHKLGVLSRLKTSSWGILSDFTHTGFQHIVRRNSPTHTGPNYPDQEIVQALRLVTALGLLATIELTSLSGHENIARATKLRVEAFAANRAGSLGK